MTTFDRPSRPTRLAAVTALALVGVLALAGCGGVATPTPAPATPAPTQAPATATPAPTPTPTAAPTPTPTPNAAPTATPAPSAATGDLGGFAFKPGDVLDYYVSLKFKCDDARPSTQAKDHTIVICRKAGAAGTPTQVVALVVNSDGVTGDAFAGVVNPAGGKMPTAKQSLEHLAGFLGAMLGKETGGQAANWLATNLGQASAQDTFGGILTGTYTSDDKTGVGVYVEVANQAFLDAPAP